MPFLGKTTKSVVKTPEYITIDAKKILTGGENVDNNQVQGTLQSMRNVLNQMRQQELNNAEMAQELSAMEAANQDMLTSGGSVNAQMMAGREGQAANNLGQLANAENGAAQQLAQLDQMLSELENQMQGY